MRKLFGDLRLKHTWERAYSHFFINWVVGCAVDGDTYFGVLDPSKWIDWEYELRFLTLEAIAAHPETESLTSNALSYLVRYKKESLATGFIQLVEEARLKVFPKHYSVRLQADKLIANCPKQVNAIECGP